MTERWPRAHYDLWWGLAMDALMWQDPGGCAHEICFSDEGRPGRPRKDHLRQTDEEWDQCQRGWPRLVHTENQERRPPARAVRVGSGQRDFSPY